MDGGRSDGQAHSVRLAADTDLVALLAKHDFTGPVYDRFEQELVRYAWAVLMAWLVSGEIFARCGRKGIGLAPPPEALTYEDRTILVTDTLVPALQDFRRRALVNGGWDEHRGATLTTYLVGGLPVHFANAYRRWQRYRPDPREEPHSDPSAAASPQVSAEVNTDPQEIVSTHTLIRDALNDLDSATARVLVLTAYGYQQTEIAELLDRTPRAVEGILHRHRHRIQRAKEAQ